MKAIEFYTFEDEVRYRLSDGTDSRLTENDNGIIKHIVEYLEAFHPKTLVQLNCIYSKRLPNVPFYRFGMTEHFARCNFGSIDNVSDINSIGKLNLEHVPCPLRGICENENIICHPEFNSRISASEMRVLELIFQGYEKEIIVDKLCISLHTVNNHIRNAYTRLGFHEKAEFIDYAHRNHLFKEK